MAAGSLDLKSMPSPTNRKPVTQSFSLLSKHEAMEFMSVFPDIVRDVSESACLKEIPQLINHFAKVLEYNICHGKKHRGFGVVAAYKLLESCENLTSENIRLANILGWCVEMLHGCLLIADDIIDASDTRHGIHCWYKNEDVGMNAITDSFLIEHGMYLILKKYFSGRPFYIPLIELFSEMTLKVSLGQRLDTTTVIKGKPQLDKYTMSMYTSLTKYKTSDYSFYMPLAVAMHLAGKFEQTLYEQVKPITMEMGRFYQVENDYLDCFGMPDVTGKIGTDIQEGKCTWLVVTALERATPVQRHILEEHYGKRDKTSETAVRNLYLELDLPRLYSTYKEESINLVRTHIELISNEALQCILFRNMENIYKRECRDERSSITYKVTSQ